MDRNVLENFIEWANKEYLPNDGKPVCWDKLKEFYESVQTNPDEKPVIVVMAGDGRVNSSKFKALFHTKPSMIQRDQVEAITGFAPGGVCPFNVPNEIPVWLDVSIQILQLRNLSESVCRTDCNHFPDSRSRSLFPPVGFCVKLTVK